MYVRRRALNYVIIEANNNVRWAERELAHSFVWKYDGFGILQLYFITIKGINSNFLDFTATDIWSEQ